MGVRVNLSVRRMFSELLIETPDNAGVLELVDKPVSKTGGREAVRVRVPSPAPFLS